MRIYNRKPKDNIELKREFDNKWFDLSFEVLDGDYRKYSPKLIWNFFLPHLKDDNKHDSKSERDDNKIRRETLCDFLLWKYQRDNPAWKITEMYPTDKDLVEEYLKKEESENIQGK